MKTKVTSSAFLAVLISVGAPACAGSEGSEGFGDEQDGSGGGVSSGGTSASGGSLGSTGGGTSAGATGGTTFTLDAPDTADVLVPWLEAGNYKTWLAEPEYHESSGPHGDAVKVFYSEKAVASLTSGDLDLSPGSAVVKELTSAGNLYGWGVYVRGRDLDGNAGIYFYELIKPSQVYGDAYNSGECTGCHTNGNLILSELERVGF